MRILELNKGVSQDWCRDRAWLVSEGSANSAELIDIVLPFENLLNWDEKHFSSGKEV